MNNNLENNDEVLSENGLDKTIELLELEQLNSQENTFENSIPEMLIKDIDSNLEVPTLDDDVVENVETILEPLVFYIGSNENVDTVLETPVFENEIVENNSSSENVDTVLETPIFENEIVENNSSDNNDSNIKSSSDKFKIEGKFENNKKHFGFKGRVILLGIITIIFLVIAIVFGYLALNYTNVKNLSYNEKSSITYSVCLNDNDYYKGRCQSGGMQYISSLTKSIPITFNYNVNYSNFADYKIEYYVIGKVSIYDRDDASKVLYKDDKLLLERTKIEGNDVVAKFNAEVEVDFKEKNDYVNGYKSKYALNSLATYKVILYVDDGKGPKEVASVSIPLSSQTFNVSEDTISKESQILSNVSNSVISLNVIFGIICLFFGILGSIIFVKLFILIYKTIDDSSLYQKKLNQILAEYDRVIIISKNGYKVNEDKQFIKLDNFFELLDARDTLEKPIIYEKVNNVKSYFYVEDDERIYRYAMKESDFESK